MEILPQLEGFVDMVGQQTLVMAEEGHYLTSCGEKINLNRAELQSNDV